MSDKAIYWSVTINNPNSSDEECVALARQRGWIVEGQQEVGENGTPHYQLSVNTRQQQRFSALKKVFPRGHIEAARNPKALKQYVKKEETRVAELPNSDKYVTSQKVLWELVVDELTGGDCPKEHRLGWGGGSYYDNFNALKAFDYACDMIIRRGYHCVENMAVNPQVRSAWKTFWDAIYTRRELDRQTDRHVELISRADSINTEDGEEGQDDETTSEVEGDEEDEDYEDSGSEASEGSDQSGGSRSGSSDASSESGE